jgi:hypothetical protein
MPEWLKDAAMLAGILWFGSLLLLLLKKVLDRFIGGMEK